MKRICFQIALLFCALTAQSQRYFSDYMIVGSSLTYIWNNNIDDYGINNGYDEYTWNVNAGIRLSKRIFAGLQYLSISSSEYGSPKKNYQIYGFFTQYDFLNDEKTRVFVETSFNRGNYCTAGYLPYYTAGLYYIGFGAGLDFPIKKIPNLYADLSFISYTILNQIKYKHSYTQYVVGLNYRFNTR